MPNSQVIYKVCDASLWNEATKIGQFAGAEIDLADGFIHFSAGHQLLETVAKHFAGRENLVLISVPTEPLGEALKWEKSRGGDLFPHLYGQLPTDLATRVDPLSLGDDGKHVFPADLPLNGG